MQCLRTLCAGPGTIMPLLTQSDLSDLARYPASLRSAAKALWGAEPANARSGAAYRATIYLTKKGAGSPPGDPI
jgi:hypothetical protein